MNPGIKSNKTLADKLMHILNYNTQNYPFCRLQLRLKNLDTYLNKPTNKNLIKVLKVVKTSVINSLMNPSNVI